MPFRSAEAFRHYAQCVKHDRRFIYEESVTSFLSALEETAKSRIKTLPKDTILWRAQLGSDTRVQDKGLPEEIDVDVPYFESRMRPAPSKVGDGRANPRGVAYLYLANSENTAGSEVRPWLGALISMSQFKTRRELKIVDCTTDKKRWFKLFDASQARFIPWEHEEFESVVWGDIGEAMSTPYSPEEASLNYVPTQIIAEQLRHAGTDGIAYRSLLADGGTNFVLFDVSDASPINFTLYETDRVTYIISQRDNTYFAARSDAGTHAGVPRHDETLFELSDQVSADTSDKI